MDFDIREVDSTPVSNPTGSSGSGSSGSGETNGGSGTGNGTDTTNGQCDYTSTKNETCGETQQYVDPPACTSYKCQTEPPPCYSAKCSGSIDIRKYFNKGSVYKVGYSTSAVYNQNYGRLYKVDTSREYTQKNTTLNNLAQNLCSNGKFKQMQANGEVYYSCTNGNYKSYSVRPVEGTEQFEEDEAKPSTNEQRERMYQARKVREACVVPNSSSSYSCNASIFY